MGLYLQAVQCICLHVGQHGNTNLRPAPLLQIWVISRHYSDDVHMSGLLERIEGTLQVGGGGGAGA